MLVESFFGFAQNMLIQQQRTKSSDKRGGKIHHKQAKSENGI